MSRVAWDRANDKTAETMVTELGSLALAIVQAGAYMCIHECDLAVYLNMYRVYRGELLEQYKDLTHKLDDYQWTVFTTWRVSLGKMSPRAIELFHLLAFMHHDRIPEETFRRACLQANSDKRVALTDKYSLAEGTVTDFLSAFRLDGSWHRPTFFRLVAEIRSYSLIDFDPTSGYYSIHPLVHSWIRTTIEHVHEAEQRTTILLALSIDNEFGADDHDYRAKLVSHIDTLSAEFSSDPNIARKKFAIVYDEAGRFQTVKSLREAVVEADKRIFAVDHPDTLIDMLDLANAYQNNGELSKAEKLHTAVLEARTRVLGEVHTGTCRAMAYLALTYHDQSRYQEAEVLQTKVLEAAKELL